MKRDAITLGVALLLLVLWDASALDMALIRPWASADGFVLRDHALLKGVAHDGGRLLGFVTLGLLALNVLRPLPAAVFGELPRPERLRWLLMTLACLLAVPALKQASPTSCPWDLWAFGGLADHFSHWRIFTSDHGPGRCFPSGHAVAAFAFVSGWFVLRDSASRAARGWLLAVLLLGSLFGAAQMLRGAHFASHTLWSAWLCAALCTLMSPRVALNSEAPEVKRLQSRLQSRTTAAAGRRRIAISASPRPRPTSAMPAGSGTASAKRIVGPKIGIPNAWSGNASPALAGPWTPPVSATSAIVTKGAPTCAVGTRAMNTEPIT